MWSAWPSAKPWTLFLSCLRRQMGACGLDRCTVCWLKNWLDGWAQRVVVPESHPAAGWPPVPVLLSIFVADLDKGFEATLSLQMTPG